MLDIFNDRPLLAKLEALVVSTAYRKQGCKLPKRALFEGKGGRCTLPYFDNVQQSSRRFSSGAFALPHVHN